MNPTPEMLRAAAEHDARQAHWARNERIARRVVYACFIIAALVIFDAFTR